MPINQEGGYADTPRPGYGHGSGYAPSGGYRPTPQASNIPKSTNTGGVEDIDPSSQVTQGAAANRKTTKKLPMDDEILKMLQEFYDEFNSPLDFNDPLVANIVNNARATTLQRAGNAGVFGPYSQNLGQQAYIKSAAGLQDSRSNRAQQALAMLTDYKKDKRNFDYQKAQDAYTSAMDKWKYDQEHNSDLWRGIGGGLGAIGGGILGLAGGPAGVVAGAAGGFGLGQQIGGGAYQAFNPGSGPPAFNPNSYRGNGT